MAVRVRSRQAAHVSLLTFVCVLAAWSAAEVGAVDCPSQPNETVCESFVGECYFSVYDAGDQGCRPIPILFDDCECTHASGTCLDTNIGGSGCQPVRFCVYGIETSDNCVTKNVTDFDDCLEDGIDSCVCAPTEYCEGKPKDSPVCNDILGAAVCGVKTAPTLSPSFAPVGPTGFPTPFEFASKAPTPDEGLTTDELYAYTGAGAGGGLLVLSVVLWAALRKTRGGQEIKGLISAQEYLDHARPKKPDAVPKREELTDEQLASEGMKLVATYDFVAENDDELSVAAGTFLIGLLKYDEWWEARTLDGEFGIVPVSYVFFLALVSLSLLSFLFFVCLFC